MKHCPRVSIIIINFNGLEDTIECLESLREIRYPNYQITLVDNASAGDDIDVLKTKYGNWIEIIKNKENLGFAGANNVAIKNVLNGNFDYILFLNNDTIVQPIFLDHLVAAAQNYPEVGLLTPKICYYSTPNRIWMAGGCLNRIRATGCSIGEGKNKRRYNRDRYVTFASGCCILARKAVFKKIGLWDENYFLYLEDVDLSKRALSGGFKILYVSKSIIYHKVNITSKKISVVLPLYYATRNRFYFSRKLLGRWFYLSLPYILGTMKIKSILWEIRGDTQKPEVIKQALRDFLSKKMGKNQNLHKLTQ